MTQFNLPLLLAQDGGDTAAEPVEAPIPPTPPADATRTLQPPSASEGLAPGTPPPGGKPPFDGFMLILLLGFAVMIIFMMGGQRKEKKKRAAMLSALKKGDRVTTVGGILGSVVEVKENEVVLKVDENSNTRMRFSRAAIQAILEDKSE